MEGSIYKSGVTWYSLENFQDATDASLEAFDAGYVADSFSWWCGNGGDGTAGYAWVGSMCDDPYNTNINEWQENTLRSAYVSIMKYFDTTILQTL